MSDPCRATPSMSWHETTDFWGLSRPKVLSCLESGLLDSDTHTSDMLCTLDGEKMVYLVYDMWRCAMRNFIC